MERQRGKGGGTATDSWNGQASGDSRLRRRWRRRRSRRPGGPAGGGGAPGGGSGSSTGSRLAGRCVAWVLDCEEHGCIQLLALFQFLCNTKPLVSFSLDTLLLSWLVTSLVTAPAMPWECDSVSDSVNGAARLKLCQAHLFGTNIWTRNLL